jgi:hypothetical protein
MMSRGTTRRARRGGTRGHLNHGEALRVVHRLDRGPEQPREVLQRRRVLLAHRGAARVLEDGEFLELRHRHRLRAAGQQQLQVVRGQPSEIGGRHDVVDAGLERVELRPDLGGVAGL